MERVEKANGSAEPSGLTPESISADDLEWWRLALTEAREANRQAEAIRQQFAQIQVVQQRKQGALAFLFDRLRVKHNLSPTDDIDENGVIIRHG